MKIKLLLVVTAVFYLLCFQVTYAQCPPNPQALTLTLAATPAITCAGSITLTLNTEAANYDHLTYEVTGVRNIPESNFTGGTQMTIPNMPGGAYTVTVRAICASNPSVVQASDTKSVTVAGNYQMPTFNAVIQRKPLSDCIASGILRITRGNTGVAPYKVVITSSPGGTLNGKEYVFPTGTPNYVEIHGLAAGSYTYSFRDNCSSLDNFTLDLKSVSTKKFGYPEPYIDSDTIIRWKTDESKTCNSLIISTYSNRYFPDLIPYAQNKDTLDKYFRFTYSIDGGPQQPLTDWDCPGAGSISKTVTGISFAALRGKSISITQTFNPAIVPAGCSNPQYISRQDVPAVINSLYPLGKYFVPEVVQNAADCTVDMLFPTTTFKSGANRQVYQFFCYPVTYQILNWDKTPYDNKIDTLYSATDQRRHPNLPAGSYYVHILSDGSGSTFANWADMPFTIAPPAAIGNGWMFGQRDHGQTAYDFGENKNEQDRYFSTPTAFISVDMYPAGISVTYTKVPPIPQEINGYEGIVRQGDTFVTSEHETYLYMNQYSNGQYIHRSSVYKYMVPGDYEAEITLPCQTSVTRTFTIKEPALNNWDYTLTRSCSGEYLLTPKAGITQSITSTPYINYNNSSAQGIRTDGNSSLVLPGPGTYKIYFYSDMSYANRGDAEYAYYVREVTVPELNFSFDETKTGAYNCQSGNTVVSAMAWQGSGTYRYVVRTESSLNADDWTPISGSEKTLGEGEVYVYDQSALPAGTRVRIEATQLCGNLSSTTIRTITTVVSLGTELTISGAEPPVCVGSDITLRAAWMPNATYQWYYNDDGTHKEENKIQGATSFVLTLNNIQYAQGGKYSCLSYVSSCDINVYGEKTVSVTSCQTPAYRWWYLSSPYSNGNPVSFDIPAGTLGGNTGSKLGYYYEPDRNYTEPFSNTETLGNYTPFPLTQSFMPGRGIVASLDTTISLFNPPRFETFQVPGRAMIENPETVTIDVYNTTHTDSTHNFKRGKNLLGNPYLSHLDFSKFQADNSDVLENTMWLRGWHNSGNRSTSIMVFETYNTLSGGTKNINDSVDGHIPPVQGFWVQAVRDGSVTFHKTGHRSAGSSQLLRVRLAASLNRTLRLRVTSSSNISDETLIVFNPEAQNGYDSYDSEKMSNYGSENIGKAAIPELYTRVDNRELAINGMSPVNGTVEIPLGFRTDKSGEFSISVNTENINNCAFYLWDRADARETELSLGRRYTFKSSAYDDTKRFVLTIAGITNSTEFTEIATRIFVTGDNRIAVCTDAVDTECSVYSIQGQKVAEETILSSTQTLNTVLEAGVYIVKIGNKTERVTVK